MKSLFVLTVFFLATGCASYQTSNDFEASPLANSNLHNIKARPAVTEPKPTRSFWNWFDEGLTHATLRTYRDRRWIKSRDRMTIDGVEYERQITGSCGVTGCDTKTKINRQ